MSPISRIGIHLWSVDTDGKKENAEHLGVVRSDELTRGAQQIMTGGEHGAGGHDDFAWGESWPSKREEKQILKFDSSDLIAGRGEIRLV